MRDQCGLIFRQARRELEAAGLLPDSKEGAQGTASTSEDSLASDIDRELENLQVKHWNFFIFMRICAESNVEVVFIEFCGSGVPRGSVIGPLLFSE